MSSNNSLRRILETHSMSGYSDMKLRNNGLDQGILNTNREEVHLRDYWRALKKYLWLIVLLALGTTVATTIYVAKKPDIYQAQARVEVDVESSSNNLTGLRPGTVIFNNPYTDPVYFNTQLQILTGSGLLRRVAKSLDLENNKDFSSPRYLKDQTTWTSLERMFTGKRPKELTGSSSASLTTKVAPQSSSTNLEEAKKLSPYVGALRSGLKVEPVKDSRANIKETRLIDIRYDHQDPVIAAKVANAIADAFVVSNLEKKTENNTTMGQFLQKRIAELQSQIRNGEERLISYSKDHQILSLNPGQNTVVERLAGLNKQLLDAENDRKLAEAAYNAAMGPGAALALSAENGVLVSLETKLEELKQKRSLLLIENTEEWPEVKEITEQIQLLEEQVNQERSKSSSTVLTNLETKYKGALERENSLRAAFSKQRGETVTQNEAAINYKIIQQEIDTNKTLLDGLLQRSKENDVILAGIPNNVHVIDYALAPGSPIAPSRIQTIILSLILSLSFGIGLAFFMQYLDDTMHSSEEVERLLHLPALAVIPSARLLTRKRIKAAATSEQQNPELITNITGHNPLAEAYRQLRTSILLSTPGGPPKRLLVTSSLRAEGKTTTVVNTALSLSQTGAKVLIIDGDLRCPRQHSIFGLDNSSGLSTILSSQMSEAETYLSIQRYAMSDLYILTSGPIPPNPAELLGSRQMTELLATLEQTFTHIIIDSPPVASVTDGVLLSTMVDGVILVVRGGKSSKQIVKRSAQQLRDVGAKLYGTILNNVKLNPGDYYYHQYYNYYYKPEAKQNQLS
jgi:polysaccharide biosynthesis transport protein